MFLRLKKLWLALSHSLSFVMSSILLAILWMTLFALYALILKIFRFFGRPSFVSTYWIETSNSEQGNMSQQF